MLSLQVLYPLDALRQHGAFLCILTWEMPAQTAPGGMICTTAARLLVLSKN